ncbi:hypothetical protein J3A78_000070 [Streptomyces sp. PvR006]|uniref:hypothetical protein n=1 Tax=Streptomyces sp. PvR006 TaxID=2817860 RepID=UPI001FDA048F|nr:hypothetical protein [Streptomyces sp. PvR006]MBP2579592.1 hypothetical protein [Streptomyces sp. PvR006]
MEWATLVTTLASGLIAIPGTVPADRLRTRQEHPPPQPSGAPTGRLHGVHRGGRPTHTELRRLAQNGAATIDLEEASRLALTDARIHEVRECLFLHASARTARTGQPMLECLQTYAG